MRLQGVCQLANPLPIICFISGHSLISFEAVLVPLGLSDTHYERIVFDNLDAFCGAMYNLLNGEMGASLDRESTSMVLELYLNLLIDLMSCRFMYASKN